MRCTSRERTLATERSSPQVRAGTTAHMTAFCSFVSGAVFAAALLVDSRLLPGQLHLCHTHVAIDLMRLCWWPPLGVLY